MQSDIARRIQELHLLRCGRQAAHARMDPPCVLDGCRHSVCSPPLPLLCLESGHPVFLPSFDPPPLPSLQQEILSGTRCHPLPYDWSLILAETQGIWSPGREGITQVVTAMPESKLGQPHQPLSMLSQCRQEGVHHKVASRRLGCRAGTSVCLNSTVPRHWGMMHVTGHRSHSLGVFQGRHAAAGCDQGGHVHVHGGRTHRRHRPRHRVVLPLPPFVL